MCGCDVPIYHKDRWERKNIFCSKKCEGAYKKSQTELNCTCVICGKKYHMKQSHINKYGSKYCSKECHRIAKMEYMKGDKNHQYGLKGELNSSWKSDERTSYYGYKLIRVLNHPFKNSDDMVFEHRLVAEQFLLTDENKVTINGVDYLSNDYHVHHLDFDRLNNAPDNLYVVTQKLHMQFHIYMRKLVKKMNNNRRVEDVFTKEELRNMFFDFISNHSDFGSTGK